MPAAPISAAEAPAAPPVPAPSPPEWWVSPDKPAPSRPASRLAPPVVATPSEPPPLEAAPPWGPAPTGADRSDSTAATSMRSARRQPRQAAVLAAVVALAAAGVSLIIDAQRSSGASVVETAPSASSTASATAPPPAGAPAPVDGSAAPTTAPAPTSTTAAPPPPPPSTAARAAAPTPTTAPRPRPPATPAPTAPPPTAPDPAAQLRQVQAIADTSGWDWRKVHVNFKIGFDPAACCHWGVYDPADHKTIWIGPTAFGDDTRLRYVVLHELGHAWQWHTHRLSKLEADMAPWGYSDLDALEAGADCIATDWGADVHMGHYWTCPPDAQALMASRLAGQWK
jgi:hypothetical protein